MDRLANMIAFVTVAETGSFSKTADRLHIAGSVVSKRIKDLEAYLGTQLLRRTTRRIALTEAGYAYADHAKKFLDNLAEVEENLRFRNENPVGEIRITAPSGFGNKFLGPALAGFLETFPDVTVTLSLDDRKVDLAAEGFDLAIRIGAVEETGLIMKKLAQSRRIVVASPAYLQQHGRPATPEDLARHNCMSGCGEGKVWPFQKDGRTFTQRTDGRFVAGSDTLLCEAAVRGCGIALLPSFIAGVHVVAGELQPLLEEFESPPLAIQAVYPERRFLGAKTRKLIDHLAATFSGFGGE